MILRRSISTIKQLATQFKSVALIGPRQSGKSTLARMAFPDKNYISLENPDIKEYALSDPRGFLHDNQEGAIIDEAQRAPELFNYLQQILDESQEKGRFILTGSNNFLMLEGISQSLAGRIGYLELLPFSINEVNDISGFGKNVNERIFLGGYPTVTFEGIDSQMWFSSYIRTYIERDVRQIRNITNLSQFQRLLYLCAGRVGQQLNLSNLAVECGLDHKTIHAWIGILQASYIIHLLPPYYNNFSKRIIKAPKLYFYDSGLVNYLLGIKSSVELSNHPSRGALFENFIVNELLKNRFNKAQRSNLFYWRDVSGHEIDILIDQGQFVDAVEIKAGMTVRDDFFKGLKFWRKLTDPNKSYLIYTGEEEQKRTDNFHVLPWIKVVDL